MAVFKCKMCGGDLNVKEGQSIIECEYCGNVNTIPKVSYATTSELYNRANELRIRCEFDQAEKAYEKNSGF